MIDLIESRLGDDEDLYLQVYLIVDNSGNGEYLFNEAVNRQVVAGLRAASLMGLKSRACRAAVRG